MKKGLLVTADGEVFEGRSVGVDGVRVGEAVFNTSMTGYQEVLSDPLVCRAGGCDDLAPHR